METQDIPAELIAEAQALLDRIPQRQIPYMDLLASFEWRPIDGYDKVAAPVVLLRAGDEACAGSWGAATCFPEWADDPRATWRSAEHASFEMPIRFEPEEFAILDTEALIGFMAS